MRKAPDCVFHHTGRMKQMCDVIERPDHPLCMKEYVELYAPKQFKWKTGGDDEVPDDVVPSETNRLVLHQPMVERMLDRCL